MDVSESETIDQKVYLKEFRGGFIPLNSPPGSACGFRFRAVVVFNLRVVYLFSKGRESF